MEERKQKIFDICMKVLKYVVLVTYIIVTILLISILVKQYISDKNMVEPENTIEGLGLVFAIVIAILAPIGLGAITLFDIIGLIISIIEKNSIFRKKNIKYFLIMIFVLVITYFLILGFGYLLVNQL